MEFQDFLSLEVLIPVFVAVFSVFVAWFCTRVLEHDDENEDQAITENIKAAFNPDKMNAVQKTVGSEDTKEKEEVIHLKQGLKKAKWRLEEEMTEGQKENERRIQQEQLQSIFNLMEADKEKYGVSSINDVKEQMKRYQTG